MFDYKYVSWWTDLRVSMRFFPVSFNGGVLRNFQLFDHFRIETINLEDELDYELDVDMNPEQEDALLDEDNCGKLEIYSRNMQ